MARVLVVEDDAAINDVVATRLARDGHEVTQAFSGSEARLLLGEGASFDVVVCDLMLPGATGEELVGLVRARQEGTPVVVISARTTAADKVELLRLGADDYLTKPFDLDELAVRVEVQLRHRAKHPESKARDNAAAPESTGGAISFRDWMLDPSSRTFAVKGDFLPLTRIEFNLLETMMRQPKRAFSKQDLFEKAWGEPYAGDDSTVTVHVSNIRAKLKESGTDAYIKTVWGIGFKLDEA